MAKSSYRDLIVWQKAIDLVPAVYALIRRFPQEENFALTQQVRRAVVSVSANVAEGQARNHRKEFAQHLSVAKGSLAELDTLLTVAERLGYLSQEDLSKVEALIADVRRPLGALIEVISKPGINERSSSVSRRSRAPQNSELRTQNFK